MLTALTCAAALAALFSGVALAARIIRMRARDAERRIRAYTVIAGRVSVYESLPGPPRPLQAGDEWGEIIGGRWCRRVWNGSAWERACAAS